MARQELYLIRHAKAEERGRAWPDDSRRPLSRAGIEQMRKAARGLVRLGVSFDVVATSPYVRTKQTADLLAASFVTPPPIVELTSLAPEGSVDAMLDALAAHARRGRMAIVGHEPGLGELAARLTGLPQALEFKKGAVCRIDARTSASAGAGAIRWFMTAKMLAAIRKR